MRFKNMVLCKVLMACCILSLGGYVYGHTRTDVEINNAWSGACNSVPEDAINPKALANSGSLLTSSEKTSIQLWDEDIYCWYEPSPTVDYDWILVSVPNPGTSGYDYAEVEWSFWIDTEQSDMDVVGSSGNSYDRDDNKFLYWDGSIGDFVQIDSCEADWTYCNDIGVEDAITNNPSAENLIFLIYGYSPYSNEDWARCNNCNLVLWTWDPK